MKYIIALLICCTTLLHAQKHDYIWLTGDGSGEQSDFLGMKMDFNTNPMQVISDIRDMQFRTVNASMSDTSGHLLFYSNGCRVMSYTGQLMENGEGLNPGYVYNVKCTQGMKTYTSGDQSILSLLQPESSSQYYIFHKRVGINFSPLDVYTDMLFYSVVDMTANFGRGKVIAKNIPLIADSLSFGEMTAVKHANGKDWWILTPKDHSNTWYKLLFTKDGIVDTLEQTIGTPPRVQASGGIQVCFSPDGSKLFRTNPQQAVKMYDFDRATGSFTGFDTISVDYHNYPQAVTSYCAVSPNGRYLYVTTILYVFQFDLWADDISASQQIVAEWDGFVEPVGITFGKMQLAPDCKIYILSVDSKYYHVIHHPDEAGLDCDVEQRGVVFPATSGSSMPSFPNYRLGPLDNPGLPCSPVVAVSGPSPTLLAQVSVFPNPATDEIKVVLNQPLSAVAGWRLTDATGRSVREYSIEPGTDKIRVPVSDLPVGVYYWHLTVSGQVAGSGKVVRI
ncbi:MAG: T9SS type A sorting domain-containing protein [Saprospiraceae bacterium]|nr:T9SS type A sorting domain-containing protein [Saprospiraceae bacterium]